MVIYIVRRVLVVVLVLAFFIPATFFLIQHMPGGPYDTCCAHARGGVPPVIRDRMENDYGISRSPLEQLLYYVRTLAQGDLGFMGGESRSVNDVIAEALPYSLQLSALSLALGFGMGVPLGTLAALRHYGWVGRVMRQGNLVVVSLPHMVLGPLLLLIFVLILRWFSFPSGGGVLPVLTLGLWFAAAIARHTHLIMLDLFHSPYIRTAQAKGLKQRAILTVHAGKNYLLRVAGLSRPLLAHLFIGLLITENIFAINGLGRYLVASIGQREYFLLLNGLLVFAVLMLLVEMVVDIAAAWLPPPQ